MSAQATKPRWSLNEDWTATLIGLVLVVIIGLGLLGPGPQRVLVEAAPGASTDETMRTLDGWQVSASIGGERASIDGAFASSEDGQRYVYTCRDGAITAAVEDATAGESSVRLVNDCDQDVTLNYRSDYAIKWPLFGFWK